MNVLATINLNNFLRENVRNSYLDAAKRWGCEYVEVTEPIYGCRDYWLDVKMSLPKHPALKGHRVMYIDADAVIRDDCPNVFELVPPGVFGAVLNNQEDPDGHIAECQAFAWGLYSKTLPTSRPYNGLFINGGVLVFEPDRHGVLFDAALSMVYKVGGDYGGGDQTAMSVLIDASHMPMRVLDWRFNMIGPGVWNQPNDVCPAYITHFAKFLDHRGLDRNERLKAARWIPFPDMPPDGTKWISDPAHKYQWTAEIVRRRLYITHPGKKPDKADGPMEFINSWRMAGNVTEIPPANVQLA